MPEEAKKTKEWSEPAAEERKDGDERHSLKRSRFFTSPSEGQEERGAEERARDEVMCGGSLVISDRLQRAPRTENQMMQRPLPPTLRNTDADKVQGTVGARMQRQQSRALSLPPSLHGSPCRVVQGLEPF